MPKQIVIGRNGNQPFPLNDPKVSGQHAVLVVYENGQIQLTDTNSTNGTFIYNGKTFVRIQPHQPYNVTLDTMLQLGPETRFHVRKVIGERTPPPPTPEYDISHLRKIYNKYTETKMALETKSSTINGLRSLTIVASVVAGTAGLGLARFLGYDNDVLIQGIMTASFLAVTVTILLIIINVKSKNLIREKNENEHMYSVKYCCPNPKCHASFKGKVYENILSERRCPKCKAKFYETPRRR